MAGLVRQNFILAAEGMLDNDTSHADEIRERENVINFLNHGITDYLVEFSGHNLPAHVPQIVANMFHLVGDLERIGDQAADIAEMIPFLAARGGAQCGPLADMARAAISMVTDSVDAFVGRYTTLAASVISRDDELDSLFDGMKHALIARIAENPDEGEYALDLLMIAKYFERIGDHAQNIAECVEKL